MIKTFIAILPHCSSFKHIIQAQAFMVTTGLINIQSNNIFLTKLISICSSLGYSNHAFSIFITQKPQPNIYFCNAVIKILALSENPVYAIFAYNRIQSVGLCPDSYSVPFVLKAIVRLLEIRVGIGIHCQAIRSGLDLNVVVATSFVQMYACCGLMIDARKVFDEFVFVKNVELWNSIVAGYAKVGDLDSACALFENMPEKNVISWTVMIAGYAQANRANEAIQVFRRMQSEDVKFDEVAMLAGLSACADMGKLELGKWIHNYIYKHGLTKTVPICNALIDMYAKSGKIKKSLQVFGSMKYRSVVTWTTMIAGLALHGLGKEALDMFSRMEQEKTKPNEITFISILSACSHAGLVKMGRWYFNYMRSRYKIEPQIEHYGCMIDLLGRAGYLQEALELVRSMPIKATGAIWGSLLSASKIQGEAELGEFALQHLMELEPSNSGNYLLLSNIYSSSGRWTEAGMLRKMMKETSVRKMPGSSFIEVNSKAHEFIAGDISHPEFDSIYKVLCKINVLMQMVGYAHEETLMLCGV